MFAARLRSCPTNNVPRWVTFAIDARRFALPLESVLRVVRAAEITPLPLAPEGVAGALDVGGRIVPVFDLRRRLQMERRRTFVELAPLVQGQAPHRDDEIAAKLKALEDIALRGQDEIRKAYAEIDALLSPVQRARYLGVQEQMRRQMDQMRARGREGLGEPPPGAPRGRRPPG